MSIDHDHYYSHHHYYVSAGMRDSSRRRRFDDCCDYEAIKIMKKYGEPKHQVFLAYPGKPSHQYYFEDPEDARWFFREGYKRLPEECDHDLAPCRMVLWIDGKKAGKSLKDNLTSGSATLRVHDGGVPDQRDW